MTVLRVIDFETNGFEPPAEVIECGTCDVSLVGERWIVDEGHFADFYACEKLRPEARAVHHITPGELEGTAPFDPAPIIERATAENISALVAHNWDFEKRWLPDIGKLHAICTYKAALRVWPDAPSHSNGALRYWLEDQGLISPDPKLCEPAHRAGPDAYVTAHILVELLKLATGREMVAWTKEPRLLPTLPIGKQKGSKWPDVDAGFLGWVMRQPDMDEDIKWNVRREIERRSSQ